jgi:predicted ATPase
MAGKEFSIPSKKEGPGREVPPRRLRHNLPAQPTSFIGREEELAETEQLLSNSRLLTLTGLGGIGKTRLALRIADDMLEQFKDGAYFVNLAAIRADGHIIQVVADALEFPLSTQAEPEEQLLHHLRTRQLLLVMDNFEHLPGAASVVSKILHAAAEVKILATSREKLELQGETIFAVSGLRYESAGKSKGLLGTDAIELFMQSARRANPGFDPSARDLEIATRICHMIQGMPLAIELATAWLDTLTLEEVADELQRSLDILSTEMRDVPERHRSIRAAFDHSWSLINEAEREVFMRLSIFRGGFARDAAHHVAGASLELLASLVGKSFVRHDPKLGRFEILELMRQYGEERLEENSEGNLSAHEAHASYFANFMSSRWDHLRDGRQIAALAEIDADIENVRTAWRYCLEQIDASRLRMFIHSIRVVYTVRGWNYAGTELFSDAVEALDQSPDDEQAEALKALAMANQGFFMAWLGLAEQGIELTRQGVVILRRLKRPVDLVFALNGVTLCAQYLNLQVEDEQAAREMVQIARGTEDKWLEAFSLFPLSTALVQQQNYVEAGQFAEQCLAISEEIGDSIISSFALSALGAVAFNLKEYGKARDYWLRQLGESEQLSYRWAIENSSKYLGHVALAMNEIEKAETYFQTSLRIAEEIGLGRDIINLLYEFARVRVAQDRKEQAVGLLALVLQHPASRQGRFGEGLIQDTAQSQLDELVEEAAPGPHDAAIERGKKLVLEDVVAELIE